MASSRRSRRAASSNASELDALSDRFPIKHPDSGRQLTYQILPVNDSACPKAFSMLKASLNLLDIKHIVASGQNEGRSYSRFRTVVLRTGSDSIVAAGGSIFVAFLCGCCHSLNLPCP